MKENKRRLGKGTLKRYVAVVIAALTLLSLWAIPSAAASEHETVPVYLNGEEIVEGKAKLINGVTYVPLRAFCDEGAPYTYSGSFKIYWDAATSSAVVEGNGLYLIATQGKCYITVNGRAFYTVGDIVNLGGSIYVPIRPMAKALGFELYWDAELRAVAMTSTGERTKTADEVYNADDLYWLSRIISAESGGEPFRGKLAVGNVVINRKNSPAYPNSIWGVIFDRKHGTQFTPAVTGTIYKTPTAESILAAKACLEGYSISSTALFFLNPRIATNFWIVKNRPFEFSIGNHDFYS
jgi:N-acetylmuramoyl-L-alanine amidase